MKSFKDLSWNVSEETYREDPAISYSTLAKFERGGFESLPTLFDKVETPSLLFGSIVDTLITGTKEEFDEKYVVEVLPKISDSMLEIVTLLHSRYGEVIKNFDEIDDDILSAAGVECNYYANPKYEATRIKNIKNDCREYYNKLCSANGKTIITAETLVDAKNCVSALYNSEATNDYFNIRNKSAVEALYQLKFKSEYEGLPIRCMADLIIVSNTNKVIYPCDLKTSSKPEYMFYKSFVQWRYDIQAQLYWYIIRSVMDKDEVFKDYTLANYRFIVVNRNTLNPLVWEYPDTQCTHDLQYGKNGEYTYRNWRSILKELYYYLNTDNVKVPVGIHQREVNNIVEWLNK